MARQKVADRYTEALSHLVKTPVVPEGYKSSWAQYTIRSEKRAQIHQHLKEKGIPSAIYYICPLHLQPAFKDADGAGITMPISEQLSQEVLSLPIHPYLESHDQQRIIDEVSAAFLG